MFLVETGFSLGKRLLDHEVYEIFYSMSCEECYFGGEVKSVNAKLHKILDAETDEQKL